MNDELANAEIHALDAYWRAANYLSVGQIYLLDNPLLKEPLQLEHIKPRLLGHWGTTPGLNFIYAHLNRIILRDDRSLLFIAGPGHGGPALAANAWLEGRFGELQPELGQSEAGLARLFKQFSFPGGIGSHATPEIPGSINEGGELGYSLAHAFGAAFDNPELIVACVVGDGEAETGPLAAAWHSNKFLHPARDGAVLPILHLNGYKIANPTLLARIPREELASLLTGYGYHPYFVEGEEPMQMHRRMARTLEQVCAEIDAIQTAARAADAKASPAADSPSVPAHAGAASAVPGARTAAVSGTRPRWPMIVLVSPKGWTGPKSIDGKKTEGSWRSHQVPLAGLADNPEHLRELEVWLRSYQPQELFEESGAPVQALRALAPRGARRMSANPHANGGAVLRDLKLPDFRTFALEVPAPGAVEGEATRTMGALLREVIRSNAQACNFRLFGPDETVSNRLGEVFKVTDRTWMAQRLHDDEHLAPEGRVMEILSEHTCQGWLEGYLLTGRHGLFSCYEAFIHIVDSMFNQHAKWLKVSREVSWRRPVASLNILLTSHVWRQDHNGFSHQDPGFIDLVVNKKADIIRVYLPPDANTLLWVTDCCLRSRNRVNVIVAGKQRQPQWFDIAAAEAHCAAGIGELAWAGNCAGGEPNLVLACAGDVPTLETLAATDLLRRHAPELKVRVVNIVDLMTLQPPGEHPNGLTDKEFDRLFTTDKPILFAWHGYPWLIHRLTYRRTNHANLHVRGYIEEGTTTTPFDMVVRNHLDRFHLLMDIAQRVPMPLERAAALRKFAEGRLAAHEEHIRQRGEDLPEVREWRWPHMRP